MSEKKYDGKKEVSAVAGFDRGPADFVRGSRGTFGKTNFKSFNTKSFIGMRRGSK